MDGKYSGAVENDSCILPRMADHWRSIFDDVPSSPILHCSFDRFLTFSDWYDLITGSWDQFGLFHWICWHCFVGAQVVLSISHIRHIETVWLAKFQFPSMNISVCVLSWKDFAQTSIMCLVFCQEGLMTLIACSSFSLLSCWEMHNLVDHGVSISLFCTLSIILYRWLETRELTAPRKERYSTVLALFSSL